MAQRITSLNLSFPFLYFSPNRKTPDSTGPKYIYIYIYIKDLYLGVRPIYLFFWFFSLSHEGSLCDVWLHRVCTSWGWTHMRACFLFCMVLGKCQKRMILYLTYIQYFIATIYIQHLFFFLKK